MPSMMHTAPRLALAAALIALVAAPCGAQRRAESTDSAARAWTTADDHRHMMAQLGITALRPGPSGDERAPNAANYDEARATPFATLPDPLRFDDGTRVRTARQWARRRAEIVEQLEREVYGRVPERVPVPVWRVVERDTGTIGGRRVVGRRLVGHVEDPARPALAVDIPVTLVLPTGTRGPVPVMIMFTWSGRTLAQALGRPAPPGAPAPRFVPPPPAPGSDAPAIEQLVVDGWGFALLDPTAVQADDGAGLVRGIVGLANGGRPRTPEQWGALRAWAWGASRLLDHLATDPAVDARRVAIEGVSRYGKAALVAMAFDQRFAAALVGSSGKGGATLHRRDFGEAVESLTGPGEYHWMAGSDLKYGADASTTGRHDARELPVDSHELLALCAPRLAFVSYGIPERGDARWLDQRGSWMAAVAAGRVWRLLGARDLGVGDDWRSTPMPPVSVGLLDGRLAWRQHDGGHTDAPNVKHFLTWADWHFGRRYTPSNPVPAPVADSARRSAATR
jgi:hypothetical protein